MTTQSIEIVEYDVSWPDQFEKERELIQKLLSPWLTGAIEHIGSTAVPGLAAKPVIDIMAPVKTLSSSLGAIPCLAIASYAYYPYKAEVMHWFCKPSPRIRTHHLHLVPLNSRLWTERLAFRDALRANPPLAAEYASLKRQFALCFGQDREGYTAAKSPFIENVLANSKQSGHHS